MAELNRTAISATLHCLTGCAIGEILGLVIATALGWGDAASIAIAIVLAFFFGYLFTMVPLLRAGLAFGAAVPLALAADTFSIAIPPSVTRQLNLRLTVSVRVGETEHDGGVLYE